MIEGLKFSEDCDWTSCHAENWQRWMGHLIGTECVGLEVGVYEGRSSAWFLENICTHPKSRLVAIDPWEAKSRDNRVRIVEAYGRRYQFFADRAEDLLSQWHRGGCRFDWIYLDGAKEAARVMEQSVLAWRMLKPGGILIWDDYPWLWTEGCKSARPTIPPGPAIDAYLAIYAGEIEVIGRGWQIAVRKIDTPRAV